MASLLDYFNNDFPLGVCLGNKKVRTIELVNEYKRKVGVAKIEIEEKIHLHSPTSIRLHTFYIPANENSLLIIYDLLKRFGQFDPDVLNLDILVGFTGDDEAGLKKTTSASRVYFYTETQLDKNEIERLDKFAKRLGLYITLRSTNYFKTKMDLEKPKAFISHDSKDKEIIAKRIASGLSSRLCPVWYDEYSLKIGDSLRESIEKGIKEAKKCVLILTPNFLTNLGWSKKEFTSIFTRELVTNEKVILPIWYGVTPKEVYEYSPSLVDTFALTWPTQDGKSEKQFNEEVEELISQIHTALTK